MKKALMYLLLALGITLGVVFVGGAVISFSAGFIDGFNESSPGSTDSRTMILSSGMILVLLTCVILNIVFLRLHYASYAVGNVPMEKRWQVVAWLVLAMAGLTLVYCMMYNPLTDSDEAVRTSYAWMKEHPVISVILCVIIEATADLIIFGGVLREILEWKHRPEIVIPVFGAVIGLLSGLFSHPLLIIPGMMIAQLEGYVYEYSRSVIPVIICDSVFWMVMLCMMGFTFPWWCLLIAAAMIIPGTVLAIKTMEPYKPID